MDDKKIKKTCIICGCANHRLFGCIRHWKNHKNGCI